MIDAQLIVDTVKTLGWMIAHMKWAHEETGLGGDYSPELKTAIEVYDRLKEELEK